MNIFFVDSNPEISAKSLHNKHLVKMAIESCQLLATAWDENRLTYSDVPLTDKGEHWKHSHYNHPCAKWVRESRGNFEWLIEHTLELCLEYKRRYNKTHSVYKFLSWVWDHQQEIGGKNVVTTPAICIKNKEIIIDNDPILSYRNYYVKEKFRWYSAKRDKWYFNKWMSLDDIPEWFLAAFPQHAWTNFIKNK